LLLSTPLVDFGAIATGNQVARLQAGLSPDAFDFQALRFDFGPVGRRVLQDLTKYPSAPVRERAVRALELADKSDANAAWTPAELQARLIRVPADAPLPKALQLRFEQLEGCAGQALCAFVSDGPGDAWLVRTVCEGCPWNVVHWVRTGEHWVDAENRDGHAAAPPPASLAKQIEALRAGKVQVRSVERRQLFIDGEPVGAAP
jgi:hypothetical protein